MTQSSNTCAPSSRRPSLRELGASSRSSFWRLAMTAEPGAWLTGGRDFGSSSSDFLATQRFEYSCRKPTQLIKKLEQAWHDVVCINCSVPLMRLDVSVLVSELHLIPRRRRQPQERPLVGVAHRRLHDAKIEHRGPRKQCAGQRCLIDPPSEALERVNRAPVTCVLSIALDDFGPRFCHAGLVTSRAIELRLPE